MNKITLSDYSIHAVDFYNIKQVRTFKHNMLIITFDNINHATLSLSDFVRAYPEKISNVKAQTRGKDLIITNYQDKLTLNITMGF